MIEFHLFKSKTKKRTTIQFANFRNTLRHLYYEYKRTKQLEKYFNESIAVVVDIFVTVIKL